MANTRRCPFYGCSKMIDPSLFACRHHWPGLEDGDRFEVWQIYTDYLNGKMHIDDLVRRQAEIMLKNTPEIVPGVVKEGPGANELAMAKKVKEYIAKRKEYTACKDGFIDRKKKIGMELSRKESEIDKMCHAILHPEQKQLTLFDGVKEDSQLPPD